MRPTKGSIHKEKMNMPATKHAGPRPMTPQDVARFDALLWNTIRDVSYALDTEHQNVPRLRRYVRHAREVLASCERKLDAVRRLPARKPRKRAA